MNEPDLKRPDSRYSWIVAIVGAVAMIFTFGTPMSYGILREPVSTHVGVSPVALSGVFSVMLFTLYIGSGIVGIFGVRVPAWRILLGCGVITGFVAPLPYFVDSYLGMTAVFALLGLTSGTVFVLVSSVVPHWFEDKRGTATGIIFVGNGLGLFLLPPLWQFVISTVGIRRGFLSIISLTALSFIAVGLICRRPHWVEQTTTTTDELFSWLKRLSRDRTFLLLYLGISLAFSWYQLLAAFAVDLFVYRGLTAEIASVAFGLIGGVSIISRIGGGYLADFVGIRPLFLGSLLATSIGIGILFVPLMPFLPVAIFFTGIGLGATATLYIPLLRIYFSAEKDTAIVGVFNTGYGTTGTFVAPLGAALTSYTEGFAIAIFITFLWCVIALLVTTLATR